MKQLDRQATLFFLLPLAAVLLIGLPYALSGRLALVFTAGAAGVDLFIWTLLLLAVLVPPIWGYRLTVRMSRALAQTTEVARRVAEGDFSRPLAAWAAEDSEISQLEQSINATAIQRKKSLAELGAEKSRFETILRTMADGVLLLDTRKKIMLVNPAAETMLGINAVEAVGRDHLEVTHNFALDEALDRVLKTGQPGTMEVKRARPEEQIMEARLAPSGEGTVGVGGAGEPRGVLLVLRDVTRARKLEQMRTEFVSNVTHELRTPLTAIRGFAETLLEGALEDAETAHHFVEIIHRESEHLTRLIEDLLDLSRIESGKFRMHLEPVNLPELAQETVGRFAQRALNQGVDLRIQLPGELPAIKADHARLAQVLLNLVDNALKYTPAGGSVTVTAVDTGPAVRITVADTGSGIPKADLPRLFERFYRVDKARSRQTGGTGLGLSIVKHIIDSHGGAIGVESDLGKGATFFFTLPKS